MNIAFIGLGNMGAPMARNLLKAGHSLNLFDLNQTVLAELAALGGTVSASPRDAAQGAALVITMLPAAAHVRSVWLGEAACWPASPPARQRSIAARSTRRPPATLRPLPPNKAWPWPMRRSRVAPVVRRPAR